MSKFVFRFVSRTHFHWLKTRRDIQERVEFNVPNGTRNVSKKASMGMARCFGAQKMGVSDKERELSEWSDVTAKPLETVLIRPERFQLQYNSQTTDHKPQINALYCGLCFCPCFFRRVEQKGMQVWNHLWNHNLFSCNWPRWYLAPPQAIFGGGQSFSKKQCNVETWREMSSCAA